MTPSDWIAVAALGATSLGGAFSYLSGRQNHWTDERLKAAVDLLKAEMRLEIQQAERTAKHDAIKDVAGQILRMSDDCESRAQALEKRIDDITLFRRKP